MADETEGTVEFLTPEWARALEAAAASADDFRSALAGIDITVQQEVLGVGAYAMVVRDGRLSVQWGAHESPDVTLVQSRETAEALSRGELNAQQAFVVGRLRVKGDLDKLVSAREAFGRLGDVFAEVRERTVYP